MRWLRPLSEGVPSSKFALSKTLPGTCRTPDADHSLCNAYIVVFASANDADRLVLLVLCFWVLEMAMSASHLGFSEQNTSNSEMTILDGLGFFGMQQPNKNLREAI